MWRICVSAVVGATMLLSGSHAARAGALAEVVQGIGEASDNDDDGGDDASSAGDSKNDSSDSSSWSSDDDGCCWSGHNVGVGYSYGYSYGPPAPQSGVVQELYVGLQSVEDSDGSFTLQGSVSYENFGIGLRGTSFYEQVGHDEYVHLDLWWLGLQYRLSTDERGAVWLDVGLSGLNSNDELEMTGMAVGLHGRRHLGGELWATAAARRWVWEDDVAATELLIGANVSILQLSYRVFDFNVGPPLHGPEVGIAFGF